MTSGVIRVMLVDDSAVIRGLFTRALEQDPEIQVVASVGDGKQAIGALKRHEIDVVVLDIEMPVMDGLTAVPLLLEAHPNLNIIMASSLTRKNADISMRALTAGARDYITKPSTTSELTSAQTFQQELIAKIKALTQGRRSPRVDGGFAGARPAAAASAAPAHGTAAPAAAGERTSMVRLVKGAPISLRPVTREVPEILAIGSSTGGPQALFTVLAAVGSVTQPIVITQHMPATFTTILAEHIARVTGRTCTEAHDGQALVGGQIYVAPGDFHMIVEGNAGARVFRLLKTPPENFCRPSVDPMLRSLVQCYGRRILVTILTGMGSDGMRGSEVVVQAGGMVIAQDEATSVVWGMPGAVAQAGLCSAVMPLDEIGPYLRRAAQRSAA